MHEVRICAHDGITARARERRGGGASAPCTIAEIAYKEGGLGSKVWESSLALAGWSVLNPRQLEQRKVLELGSGCGLGGLMLSHAGASSVCPALTGWSEPCPCGRAAFVLHRTHRAPRTRLQAPSVLAHDCPLLL